MDTRAARRTAEKAARDLINDRASLVGELAARHAEHTRRTADITTAADRGRELIAAGQTQADQLLAAARDLADDARQRYTTAYHAATTAGWTPTDLTALGFQPTTGPTLTGRRRRTGTGSGAAGGSDTTPSQPDPTNDTATHPDADHTPTPRPAATGGRALPAQHPADPALHSPDQPQPA